MHLAVGPLYHSGPSYWAQMHLSLGATVVVMPRWDRELAGRLISRHRVSHWTCIPTMIIDLSGLRFMDSSALLVILRANRAMDRQGGVLALACPREAVAKMLRLTAADQLVPVYQSVDEASAG